MDRQDLTALSTLLLYSTFLNAVAAVEAFSPHRLFGTIFDFLIALLLQKFAEITSILGSFLLIV